MRPIMLDDGHWFDADTAECWRTRDLTPHSSSHWTWEILWRTKSGRLIQEVRRIETGVGDGLDDLSAASLQERHYLDPGVVAAWFSGHGMDIPEEFLSDEFRSREI